MVSCSRSTYSVSRWLGNSLEHGFGHTLRLRLRYYPYSYLYIGNTATQSGVLGYDWPCCMHAMPISPGVVGFGPRLASGSASRYEVAFTFGYCGNLAYIYEHASLFNSITSLSTCSFSQVPANRGPLIMYLQFTTLAPHLYLLLGLFCFLMGSSEGPPTEFAYTRFFQSSMLLMRNAICRDVAWCVRSVGRLIGSYQPEQMSIQQNIIYHASPTRTRNRTPQQKDHTCWVA